MARSGERNSSSTTASRSSRASTIEKSFDPVSPHSYNISLTTSTSSESTKRIVRVFTTRVIPNRTANSHVGEALSVLCLLISLLVVACSTAPQTPEILAPAGTSTAPPPIPPPGAAAHYHFILGHQPALPHDMDRAIEDYQPA